MGRLRHRVRHPASVLLLAALLLVPVALSGHTHVDAPSHPCSICAVTHHAPLATASPPPTVARPIVTLLAAPGGALAPVRREQAPRIGRAPPAALSAVLA